MELPPLPKKYNRHEARVDGKVNAYLMATRGNSYLLEVKMKRGKLLPHQKRTLSRVSEGAYSYKFPDGFQKTPADYVALIRADAILCVVDGKQVTCTVNDTEIITFTI